MSLSAVLLAAVVVGTWNGNWFPSGRAEHRAHPAVEEATITAAAEMLSRGLAEADPSGKCDVILCLHEMRGPRAASNLVARIGRAGLRVVVISGYRRRDRFDQQQDAIATTLPVASASWSRWRNAGKETPPRGYAFAAVVVEPAVTANVYAVHLKSNYGGNTQEKRDLNRVKRTKAIEQILELERSQRGGNALPVIVAGDMNADKWRVEFKDERIFGAFESAGFDNPLSMLPEKSRGTYPSKAHGDSALDYIFVRGIGCRSSPRIIPNNGLSDHYAVFAVLDQAAVSSCSQ